MHHLVMGITAHVDSGKTTLAEAMLYKAGEIRKLGRVDHGDAFLDSDAMERARGITIFSHQAQMRLGDTEITLLDTPGHVDFSAIMLIQLYQFQTVHFAPPMKSCSDTLSNFTSLFST